MKFGNVIFLIRELIHKTKLTISLITIIILHPYVGGGEWNEYHLCHLKVFCCNGN